MTRELTRQEKAAITRKVTAEVAAEYGFPGKTIPQPPRQLITGAQGNGKTRVALENIAEITEDLCVRMYVPTLAKAQEALADYQRIAATVGTGTSTPSMPGMVVRGRGAADPSASFGTASVQMCRRFKVVERAAKLDIAVRNAICPSCKFNNVCGTLRQDTAIARLGTRAVFFMSREYAHLKCPAPDPDMVICDERMTLEAVSIVSIEPDKFVGSLVPYHGGGDLANVIAAQHTLDRLRAPLMTDQPLIAIRDTKVIDKAALRILRNLLDTQEIANISGRMPDSEIDRRLDAVDHPERRATLAIVAAVLREIDAPRKTLNAVKYDARRNLIITATLGHLDGIQDAAVQLLDGTGDPELNEKLIRSKLEHVHVRMERDAFVVGTIGKGYSRQSITGKDAEGNDIPNKVDDAKRLRDEIGTITSHYESPLLTASKDAEEALLNGGHLPPNVMTSHGGMTRGRNTWEDRATAISVGADRPSIETLELIAGAFYARDPSPIVSMAKGAEPADKWPRWPWPYRATQLRRMRDGRLQIIHVDVHPDPRVQRVLEQIREAGVTQDLDRVRPIYNRRTLVAMNELVLDLTYDVALRHRELVAGGTRITRLLRRTGGVLPLAPAALASLFPDLFGTAITARRAVEAWLRTTPAVLGAVAGDSDQGPNSKVYLKNEQSLVSYRYRCPGQRGPALVVLVSHHHSDPKAAAEAVLGPLVAFEPAAK